MTAHDDLRDAVAQTLADHATNYQRQADAALAVVADAVKGLPIERAYQATTGKYDVPMVSRDDVLALLGYRNVNPEATES